MNAIAKNFALQMSGNDNVRHWLSQGRHGGEHLTPQQFAQRMTERDAFEEANQRAMQVLMDMEMLNMLNSERK